MKLIKLMQKGDTIVEVLIALAISSLLIGGAMASANQTLLGSLRSQERGEALKIAESQLEYLRGTGFTAIGSDTSFYFSSSGARTAGAGSISGAGIPYTVNITRSSPTDHNFTVTVTWSPAGGGAGLDNVSIRYGVY
jgi:prepilin-type N-terminal cleavage/methylation domain-containing protein